MKALSGEEGLDCRSRGRRGPVAPETGKREAPRPVELSESCMYFASPIVTCLVFYKRSEGDLFLDALIPGYTVLDAGSDSALTGYLYGGGIRRTEGGGLEASQTGS